MKEKVNKRLAKILDAYDAKRIDRQQKIARKKLKHDTFLEEFEHKKSDSIRPAMQEIANQLTARGHEYDIIERQETHHDDERTENSEIKLIVYPEGERSTSSVPHIAFIADSDNSVSVHECTNTPRRDGSSGTTATYTIDQVKSKVVYGHILNVLKVAMG